MAVNDWPEKINAFSRSPSEFLSCTTPDGFLAELLRELRDDRASDNVKVLLLSPLCEHPARLCPSVSVGEETALELMSVFTQCPPKALSLRCNLLLALTSVLLCSSCVSTHTRASQDFLNLLLETIQDTNDHRGGAVVRPLRATACDCLRELEACRPGLLSQHLELLSGLRQQENSRLHQAYVGLHALGLRNAVYLLTQQTGAGAGELKAVLGGNEGLVMGVDSDTLIDADGAFVSPLTMARVPSLQTGPDCKELRSLLSLLLEESYLLTPLAQAALLRGLVEVVSMVPAVSPVIFKAQLIRLLGTSEVCLLHATLLMKAAFTDSLFSAEDEAFLLKRLVGLSQHPLISTPEKLFYMDCILHFPENRPISCGDWDDSLPVLLTPRLAAALVPTVFNDSSSMLARLNLLSLVYLEEGEEGDGEGGRGLAYLYDHLTSLLGIVENQGSREMVVTFFRASFLFLLHFCHVERYSEDLTQMLCKLYLGHTRLAPHFINLADRVQERLEESGWAVALLRALQKAITEAPLTLLTLQNLRWHLKVLGRVAGEGGIPQKSTLSFLLSVITSSSLCVGGDWRLGNSLLGVCRRLLLHPSLDTLLTPLADLLQLLTCHYGDTDIQDHARLYYTLLTTLSREKLGAVLTQGGPQGGPQAKVRSLSAIMSESEELTSGLTVKQTDRPVLRLVRLDNQKPESRKNPTPDKEPQPELSPEPEHGSDPDLILGGQQEYEAQYQNAGFASEITLQYKLTHTGVQDPRFDRLFSIHLHFDLTDPHYENVSDISVPCLFRERTPPVVSLRLRPRRPYPTTLRASAVFTTQDGLCWHSALADLQVAFPQLFLPLPAPMAWGEKHRESLFQVMWEEMVSGETERDSSENASSLFCCQLGDSSLVMMIEKHFQPFLIVGLSEEDPGEKKVLFFLPPKSHVLLKIRTEEDAVQVNIATDNWKLLPFLNSYLQMLATEQHTAT